MCQDHGQPECTEELLRAQHGQARPAPARGFRAEPSWRSGLLLQGELALASSHCLGWWSGGGQLEARRCHHQGKRWDTGILPLPSLMSLPRVAQPSILTGRCQRREQWRGQCMIPAAWEHLGREWNGSGGGILDLMAAARGSTGAAVPHGSAAVAADSSRCLSSQWRCWCDGTSA